MVADWMRVGFVHGVMNADNMTIFFRALADVDPAAPSMGPLADAFYDDAKRDHAEPALTDWLTRHAARVREDAWTPA